MVYSEYGDPFLPLSFFLGDGDVMDELIMNVYVVQGSYGTGGWIWFTEFWL